MKGYQSLFGKEYQNYLFPFFWQHGEDHETLKTFINKIYESGMKALCVEARPHPDFVGEKWWSDMDCIIDELKNKDMKMWILDDSHFPTGYANGKVKSDYPEYLKLYIQCRRYDIHGPLTQARIDLKLLKGRIWDKPEKDVHIVGVYMAKRIQQENNSVDAIDETTLLDITNAMDMETRLLTLDIPKGAYSIFVVFETTKGAEQTTEDYLNPLVKEATKVLIDEVYEPHYRHYKDEFQKTILGFFSDEPRFGNAKGTECSIGKDMPLPWRKGLDEELPFDLKYLPLLWIVANNKHSEIRVQYMDMITNLYNENFTKVLADWCEEHGVWYLGHTIEDNGAHARLGYGTGHYFRGQQAMHIAGIDVIGTQIVPGMNYQHDAFSTGGSNGEFYHYALAKLGSSAAHLDVKKEGRLMCEAFGAYGWNEGLKAMKWIADSLMVRGVNYIVPHAFNPKEFPDWDCPPHFFAHGHNPQFRYYPVLDNYMNRVMSIFREGDYPAKVGVFYPVQTEWAGNYMPIEKPCKELTINQISFDIVTSDYLKQAEFNKNCYCIHRSKFNIFIFPWGECITSDMINIIYDMVEEDIQVIFLEDFPTQVLGVYDKEKWLKVKEKSTCISLCELGASLLDYSAIQLAKRQEDLVVGEYTRDNMHFYMLFNESVSDSIDTRIQFKQKGFTYVYDAFTDTLYHSNSDKLYLTPYQSLIYVVSDKKLQADNMSFDMNKTFEEIELPHVWKVQYSDSFSYPNFEDITSINSLCFVHNIEGYEDKAGTLKYSAQLDLKQNRHTILDLGTVFETAEVFVNNQSVGVKLCKPYVFDLTQYIVEGMNQLTIEVTNTLGTQIRDSLSHYLPIEPFGIEGPVKLKIEK